MSHVLLVCLLGAVAGVSIGTVGIGGVMLVPGLHYLGGIPIPQAIAAAMMGYVLTGIVGTAIYARAGSIRWSMAGWLCAGAMPAALAGAWLSNTVPGAALEMVIAALTLGSGLHALFGRAAEGGSDRALGPRALLAIGAVTGVLSAITGTGGPLVLVPTMIWLRVPVLTAIGLSQAVQLPIATLATLGNFTFGEPDLRLGIVLALALAVGSAVGARLAHAVPRDILKRIVAGVLCLVGTAILFRVLSGLLASGVGGGPPA